MIAFYNEIDGYCCAWLSNLMDAGHITPGIISDESIEDITPAELVGYDRVHLFAGIGVWDYALRLARWPSDRPIWTLSCPCQPFSAAGKGVGFDDKRHLWPHAQWLIEQCRPVELIGEQVASGHANAWIDLVHADLEALGYAFGCVPFPSAGVGAPHIRDRAYWMADTSSERPLPGAYAGVHRGEESARARNGELERRGHPGGLDDPLGARLERHAGDDGAAGRQGSSGPTSPPSVLGGPGPTNGFWRYVDWLGCRDGKWRPVRPGSFPLVNGAKSRVGRLRAYGNAINAQAAKTFIEAYLEI